MTGPRLSSAKKALAARIRICANEMQERRRESERTETTWEAMCWRAYSRRCGWDDDKIVPPRDEEEIE